MLKVSLVLVSLCLADLARPTAGFALTGGLLPSLNKASAFTSHAAIAGGKLGERNVRSKLRDQKGDQSALLTMMASGQQDQRTKVMIVGAGPAGLLSAHYLLNRGGKYDVTIAERRSDPREVRCLIIFENYFSSVLAPTIPQTWCLHFIPSS
jgi:hypothetical protein